MRHSRAVRSCGADVAQQEQQQEQEQEQELPQHAKRDWQQEPSGALPALVLGCGLRRTS